MSVLFSKSCEYAVQAILYLAREAKSGKPVFLKEISDNLNIPYHFLSKVLQALARVNLLVSHKGAGGGFSLGKPPKEIALIDIVRAVDGDTFLDHCVLGFPGCGERNPCPVHDQWKRAKEIILNILHKKNLAELSKELDPKLRLIEKLTA